MNEGTIALHFIIMGAIVYLLWRILHVLKEGL